MMDIIIRVKGAQYWPGLVSNQNPGIVGGPERRSKIWNISEVDIIELNRASLLLKYQVTNKRKLVFSRNEEKARDFDALIRKNTSIFILKDENTTNNN